MRRHRLVPPADHPRTALQRFREIFGISCGSAAALLIAGAATGCASVAAVDPIHGDDGLAGFAAACVGVLAAERAITESAGGAFGVDEHRAMNEWMFQASRRRGLLDDEIGRAGERRRWAEDLPAADRAARLRVCVAPEEG